MTHTPHRTPRRRLARRLAGSALGAALVLVAAACGGSDDEATETTLAASTVPETTEAPATTAAPTTEAPTTTTTTVAPTTLAPTTTTEAPIPRMPLTGVPLAYGQVAPDRPALVVKIDNNPIARPQSGLNQADLVFEEVVEVGTRFAAVFHSGNSNPVGPIRSGRTQDIDLLGGLQRPLFAWSGGNAVVNRAIADSDFVDLNPNAARVYRRQGPNPKPHNYYADTDALFALATPEAGRPVPLFSYFRPGEAPAGSPAGRVEVRMDRDNVLWEYDPAFGGYLRSTNGRQHLDGLDNSRVSTTNIVILETPYRPSYADRNSPEAQTIGGGRVWVVSGGVVREGSWLRAVRTDGFALFDANGAAMPLLPGRTWVELFDPVDPAPVIA